MTEDTTAIVCPHCGYAARDSWEHPGGDGDPVDCDCKQCGEKIEGEIHVSRTFTTWKPGEKP